MWFLVNVVLIHSRLFIIAAACSLIPREKVGCRNHCPTVIMNMHWISFTLSSRVLSLSQSNTVSLCPIQSLPACYPNYGTGWSLTSGRPEFAVAVCASSKMAVLMSQAQVVYQCLSIGIDISYLLARVLVTMVVWTVTAFSSIEVAGLAKWITHIATLWALDALDRTVIWGPHW